VKELLEKAGLANGTWLISLREQCKMNSQGPQIRLVRVEHFGVLFRVRPDNEGGFVVFMTVDRSKPLSAQNVYDALQRVLEPREVEVPGQAPGAEPLEPAHGPAEVSPTLLKLRHDPTPPLSSPTSLDGLAALVQRTTSMMAELQKAGEQLPAVHQMRAQAIARHQATLEATQRAHEAELEELNRLEAELLAKIDTGALTDLTRRIDALKKQGA
jgi:hypothetical protein